MAQEFSLEDLGIPSGSEFHRLVERCGGSRLLRYGDGEALVNKGDMSKEVFLILRGGYVVQREDSGGGVAEGQITDPSAPAFVGELAYLGRGRRSASVAAVGETFALCLTPGHMDTIMEEFPMFTRILCKQFADRLRNTTEALAESQKLFDLGGERVTKKAGETIIAEGEPADTLYQLLEGSLIQESADGEAPLDAKKLFMGFLDPAAYLADGAYNVTLKAGTDATLLAIDKRAQFAVVRSLPDLALRSLKERAG